MLFHSGEVRFGDAHPASDNDRTLRIPASMYYPKLKKVSESCYIHHGYDINKDSENQQLKQCRTGFYTFNVNEKTANEIKTLKTFVIKSAYDATERRSRDGQMYGYQSLHEGQSFIFEVELTDKAEFLSQKIEDALKGKKRIGRSRTAQYGLVSIELISNPVRDYSTGNPQSCSKGYNTYAVYADGRLIFLDKKTGLPTFRPEAKDLGFKSGDIDWECSQIRTFQYAPWNFKRQARDTDRCGIEKGSVFVIKNAEESPSQSCYVGSYNNEGFGRIIYNPAFLTFDHNRNGKASILIKPYENHENNTDNNVENEIKNEIKNLQDDHNNLLLLRYLAREKQSSYYQSKIYAKVNDFVDDNLEKFADDKFASQWGVIRRIASQCKEKKAIEKAIIKYISDGVAKDQWEKRQRKSKLVEFIKETDEAYTQMAIINLAAEMAKLAKK